MPVKVHMCECTCACFIAHIRMHMRARMRAHAQKKTHKHTLGHKHAHAFPEHGYCSRVDEKLDAPAGSSREEVEIGEWEPGLTFAEFVHRTLGKTSGSNNVCQ